MKCPTTFSHMYNRHCYEWFALNESPDYIGWSFESGREFCQYHYSGDLVSWGDKEEEDEFFSHFVGIQDLSWWIGYREDQEQGDHWVDGTQSGDH